MDYSQQIAQQHGASIGASLNPAMAQGLAVAKNGTGRASTIAREVTTYEQLVNELHKVITEVSSRLDPVAPSQPQVASGAQTPMPAAASPVATSLQSLNNQLQQAVMRLNDLNQRIDL